MSTNPDAARVLSMCDYRDELSRRATQFTVGEWVLAEIEVRPRPGESCYRSWHVCRFAEDCPSAGGYWVEKYRGLNQFTPHWCRPGEVAKLQTMKNRKAAQRPDDAFTAYMRARCEDCMSRLLTDDALQMIVARQESLGSRWQAEEKRAHDLALSELSALAALCEGMEDAQCAAWKAEEGRND